MKIVIIEDEPKTAKDLARTIVAIAPTAQIVHTIQSVSEGKLFFQTEKNVDLIFSDIQLGDGLSFEIFENSPTKIPIIFCTAYNDFALQAFKTFGIDYILKPFSKDTVKSAIEKYQTISGKSNVSPSNNYANLILELTKTLVPKKESGSLLVYRGDRIIPIDTENIALLYIENAIVYAYTFDEKKLATSGKLDELENKLTPQFFRANRQFLVNRKAVKEASQHFHRKLQIHLTLPFSDTVLVGKEKVTAFLSWLEK